MRTAAIPVNVSDNITLSFSPKKDISVYQPILFFAEIQNIPHQTREFNISVSGDHGGSQSEPYSYTPPYLYAEAYYPGEIDSENRIQIWINRTSGSTLPPLLNALEMLAVINVSTSQTDRKDCM